VEADFTSVEYTYDNTNVNFIELTEYTNAPTFVLITANAIPIMVSNAEILAQFDASYNEITSNTVISIHAIWVNESENVLSKVDGITTYTVPIIDLWVYLSYYDTDTTQLYESRNVEYNLQLNKWIIAAGDDRVDATKEQMD